MNLVQSINTYLWLWQETLKGFRRPAIALPFLAFAALEALILLSSSWFHQQPWGSFWVPVLSFYPGKGALHYPGYYLAVPQFLGRLDMVLSVLVASLTTGWGLLLMRDTFMEAPPSVGRPLGQAGARYVPLAVVALLVTLLSLGIGAISAALPHSWFEGYSRRLSALRWGYFALIVVMQAALLYVPPVLLVQGRNLGEAVREGFRFFWQNRAMSFFIVALPFALTMPMNLALEDTLVLATKYRPELVLQLAVASTIVAGIATLLLTGASLRFFLYRMRLDRAPVAAAGESR